MVWQIAAATGWSVRYILWGVNYQTLRMMLADAPRYVKKKRSRERFPASYNQDSRKQVNRMPKPVEIEF